MFQISRHLALLFGIALPILETIRRWNTNSCLPSILDDWFIGVFLLLGFWATRRSEFARPATAARGRAVLVAGGGFTVGIGYASVFGHLRTLDEPDVSPVPHVIVFAIIAGGWILAILAIGCTILARPPHGEPPEERLPAR